MSEEEKKGRSRKQPKEEPQETSLGKEILSWLQIIVAAVVIAFAVSYTHLVCSSRTGKTDDGLPEALQRIQPDSSPGPSDQGYHGQ